MLQGNIVGRPPIKRYDPYGSGKDYDIITNESDASPVKLRNLETAQNSIKSFATSTWPEKYFFTSLARPV